MKNYLVKCKFGHVGRDKYLPLIIPIVADTVKQASEKARKIGGVKRDHKDWCLEGPTEVSYEVFKEARAKFNNDIYFEKRSRSRLHLFEGRLINEPNYSRIKGIKTNKKIYSTKRDELVVEFKCRKEKVVVKSLMSDQLSEIANYTNRYELV